MKETDYNIFYQVPVQAFNKLRFRFPFHNTCQSPTFDKAMRDTVPKLSILEVDEGLCVVEGDGAGMDHGHPESHPRHRQVGHSANTVHTVKAGNVVTFLAQNNFFLRISCR